ncbi:MAG: DUF2207 domain-containing protein [Candidatus Pacebacteria bacterium]|nr:DUF2207 domain-containing protein [Candidatus Paceibacterota bacterium]MDD5013356.1 DUF2207 domain-containing protein [Candidatus Paceibacterota bacterium]
MNIKSLFLLILVFFTVSPVLAEEIQNYETSITINNDASVNVQEKILYDFGSLQRHGIFRDIPYKYSARGGTYTVKISDISVFDEKGINYQFTTSTENNNLKIKIGDPNSYVSGQKTYIINYKVKKAINYFTDYDELYWNVIGGDWAVNINKSSVVINVPKNNDTTYKCLYGILGSKKECLVEKQGNQLKIEHNQVLSPKEYLTIIVGIQKGILYEPSTIEYLIDKIMDNIIFFLPFLVFIFLFIKWFKQGRDPEGKGIIIAQYEPLKDLSPLEAATLINENYDIKNVPAEIINLAIKGHIKIEKQEKKHIFDRIDYLLIKTKENDDSLNKTEKALLLRIFMGNKQRLLSKITPEDIRSLGKKIIESLTNKGYFETNPSKIKTPYIIVGVLLMLLSPTVESIFGAIGIVCFLINGIIIIVFGIIMPKKSIKGVEAKEYLLGLKKYISLAEIERIKFHNAPAKTPEHFETLLPYAMIFGLEKEWAKQFESLTYSPTWYNDKNFNSFVPLVFINDLRNFSSTGTNSMTPASSGGSGFSGGGAGGGFGGGGGGSW